MELRVAHQCRAEHWMAPLVVMFLVDPSDADAVGRVHREVFAVARPAATMVVVRGLLDPRWRVEVEAEAEV